MTERLIQKTSEALARRTSRRGFLARTALVGSAVTVAPVRYLLRPESALAVVRPSECTRDSLCRGDGFTEFCCSIREGRNKCPKYSFVGGWWKCTDYEGHRICDGKDRRYYIDCNRRKNDDCPGGCKCAEGRCDHRRVCCNVFRYGQCNTEKEYTSEVVCRVVTCKNPAKIDRFDCNRTLMIDDRTCTHEASCRCGDCR
jgi:hypothetical protein